MAVKEQIGIYQQGEKTTVVIYHMKESTKQKLIQALFADVKAAVEEGQIQEIDDLSPSVPELREQEASVDGMESLAVKSLCEKYGKDAMRLFVQLFRLFDTAPLADREAASIEIAKRLKSNAQTGRQKCKTLDPVPVWKQKGIFPYPGKSDPSKRAWDESGSCDRRVQGCIKKCHDDLLRGRNFSSHAKDSEQFDM